MKKPRLLVFLLLSVCSAGPACAQEWTRFRGPNGTGISPARGLPVAWTEADFRWRVRLPAGGHGAPVAWGERLFVTAATDEGRERSILALDRRDGRELWRKTYALPTHRPANRNAGYANSSPVVDADRVFAVFVSADHHWVRAFDHAGAELWSRDLGPFVSQHGHGASPILHAGRLIVTNDQDGVSTVTALDPVTGRVLWETPRRTSRSGTAYGTPCVLRRADGREELLLASQSHGISSLDPATGRQLWDAPVFNKRMVSSPVVAGDLVLGTCGQGGGAGNYLSAVRLDGTGNAESRVAYTLKVATPYVTTSVHHEGRVYLVSDGGVATAIEAATGRTLWSERLRAEFFASPVWVEGRLYCASTKGEMLVLAAGDEFRLLARNPLGEGTHSTPCIVGDRMYVRTFNHLVCVGAP
jgi:outer membrane protein assembly factor BamB